MLLRPDRNAFLLHRQIFHAHQLSKQRIFRSGLHQAIPIRLLRLKCLFPKCPIPLLIGGRIARGDPLPRIPNAVNVRLTFLMAPPLLQSEQAAFLIQRA